MTDAPDPPGSEGSAPLDDTTLPGVPRWLKLSAVVVVVLVLALLIIQLILGVRHGPGLHTPQGAGWALTGSLIGGLSRSHRALVVR